MPELDDDFSGWRDGTIRASPEVFTAQEAWCCTVSWPHHSYDVPALLRGHEPTDGGENVDFDRLLTMLHAYLSGL